LHSSCRPFQPTLALRPRFVTFPKQVSLCLHQEPADPCEALKLVQISARAIIMERDNIVVNGARLQARRSRWSRIQGHAAFWKKQRDNQEHGNQKFGTGIDLGDSSSNIDISDNNITNSLYGVWSVWSFNVNVSRNDIANNSNGVFLHYSFNNDISRNNIMANSDLGMSLYSSHNNTVSHNNFTMCGLVVWNPYENAVESNLVNGKPLV